MKLLIIEDSEPLRRSLRVGLSNLGFTVDDSGDGAQGLSMALVNHYDAIILDMMLPSLDGMDVLKTLRKKENGPRVLILSAKTQTQDRIDGLLEGADDYLTKPFSFEELHARLLAITRRGLTQSMNTHIRIGDFDLDTATKTFSYQQQPIELTKNEFMIVQCLFNAKGRVVTVEMISESVVGSFDHLSKNAIEAHLSSIRKKVRQYGGQLPIRNKRGFGYMIVEGC
ncbi:response regulator transcription factor [Vibrio mytili]|uniref:Chemotaxis protein CheY n=1 Tax=Vibrio mytili TaxID=50718 RepID=A0A0C3I4F3_9VIBR|nr:response regulator transcription factor [Vibrio mytili]KIN09920.1 chemotaxis protein CheY [Vibrio mytili]